MTNFPHLYSIAFALALAMVIYDEVKNCHDLPWPPRIIATGLVFALLDIFSLFLPSVTGLMAIGIVLAILLCTIENELVKKGKIQKVEGPCGLTLTGCAGHDCGTAQPSAFNQFSQSPAAPNTPPPSGTAPLPPGLSITGPATGV